MHIYTLWSFSITNFSKILLALRRNWENNVFFIKKTPKTQRTITPLKMGWQHSPCNKHIFLCTKPHWSTPPAQSHHPHEFSRSCEDKVFCINENLCPRAITSINTWGLHSPCIIYTLRSFFVPSFIKILGLGGVAKTRTDEKTDEWTDRWTPVFLNMNI
jgi:hypothetical protein